MAASSVRQPTKLVPIDSTKVCHESSVLKNHDRIFSLYIRVNVFSFPVKQLTVVLDECRKVVS